MCIYIAFWSVLSGFSIFQRKIRKNLQQISPPPLTVGGGGTAYNKGGVLLEKSERKLFCGGKHEKIDKGTFVCCNACFVVCGNVGTCSMRPL